MNEPLARTDELVLAGFALHPQLVARSSTQLEASGEWAGAFTSYQDVTPDQLPRAVVGCWASAFTVEALDRQRAAGIAPGNVPMAVLVQPALRPRAGGTAEITASQIVVHGVRGSPSQLLQGWVRGDTARWNGGWSGDDLIDVLGVTTLDEIRTALVSAKETTGATQCEWAWDGNLWILQLGKSQSIPQVAGTSDLTVADPMLIRIARLAVLAPGPLGEEMVIPWALGGRWPSPVNVLTSDPRIARRLRDELMSQVWEASPAEANRAARNTIRELRGPDPAAALDRIRGLRKPDPGRAALLMGHIDRIRCEMEARGVVSGLGAAWFLDMGQIERALDGPTLRIDSRVGLGRWDPLIAAVILHFGEAHQGTPASIGVGAGPAFCLPPTDPDLRPNPRSVIASIDASPDVAPLIWDAAALVTESGNPAAHLFASARAMGIPAICGVRLPSCPEQIVAVDGNTGVVATLRLEEDVDAERT
jgi:PEP-utilising enzyme, mobile domain/Pyruvate phosphate dikinase, AMP/ATP-binding domain